MQCNFSSGIKVVLVIGIAAWQLPALATIHPQPLTPSVIRPQPLVPSVVKPHILGGICDVQVLGSINFGKVNLDKKHDTDIGGAKLVINCREAVRGKISLAKGPWYRGHVRAMGDGSDKVYYNVYLDPNHTIIWGDGTGSTVKATFAPPFPVTINLFGRLYGNQKGGDTNYSVDLPVYLTDLEHLAPVPITPAMRKIKPNNGMRPINSQIGTIR